MATRNNVTLSLTKEEEEDLKEESKKILGKVDKTAIVRFWINKAKNEGGSKG